MRHRERGGFKDKTPAKVPRGQVQPARRRGRRRARPRADRRPRPGAQRVRLPPGARVAPPPRAARARAGHGPAAPVADGDDDGRARLRVRAGAVRRDGAVDVPPRDGLRRELRRRHAPRAVDDDGQVARDGRALRRRRRGRRRPRRGRRGRLDGLGPAPRRQVAPVRFVRRRRGAPERPPRGAGARRAGGQAPAPLVPRRRRARSDGARGPDGDREDDAQLERDEPARRRGAPASFFFSPLSAPPPPPATATAQARTTRSAACWRRSPTGSRSARSPSPT